MNRGPEEDNGAPVRRLAELEREGSSGFLGRVRRRIQRRRLAVGALKGTWDLTGAVFLEFLNFVFSLFGRGPDQGGKA